MVGVRGMGVFCADAAGRIKISGPGFSDLHDHEHLPVYRCGSPSDPVSKIKIVIKLHHC